MPKYDIFISYRRDEGKDLARMLKESLTRRGYRVFLDMDELQDGIFDQRILDAIQSAPVYILLLTAHALDRCKNEQDWVRQEIEYALFKGKHIIPINPDKQFVHFPEETPNTIREGLSRHQYSAIDTGQLYQESVDKLINERIRPLWRKRIKSHMPKVILILLCIGLCVALFFFVKSYIPKYYISKGDKSLVGDSLHNILPDTAQAMVYYHLAIEKGGISAYGKIGDIYRDRIDWFSNTWYMMQDSSFMYYRYGAWAGDTSCIIAVAGLFYFMFNSYQDNDSAYYYGKKAYDMGLLQGADALGYCYEYGFGVQKNYQKAAELFKEGMENGDPNAQVHYGLLQKKGLGTTKNEVQAAYNIVRGAVDGSWGDIFLGKWLTWKFYPKCDSVSISSETLRLNYLQWSKDDTMKMCFTYHNTRYGWIQVDRRAYVQDFYSKAKYYVSGIESCTFSPDTTIVEYGKSYNFKLAFAHVPDTVTLINFFETDTSHWKLYGIHLEDKIKFKDPFVPK